MAEKKKAEEFDVLKWMQEARDRGLTRVKELRTPILVFLNENKITNVVCSYSGSGDSGQVDGVELFVGDKEFSKGEEIEIDVPMEDQRFDEKKKEWIRVKSVKSIPIADAIRELTYETLGANFGGWENNDGASGELEIKVAEGEFTLKHSQYRIESDYEEVQV